MLVIDLILYILAACCFFVYSVYEGSRQSGEINLLGLGVFFWALVPLLNTFQALRS